ncbi:hypothetical protein VP01_1393g8, partial [Puccinia sorghi]
GFERLPGVKCRKKILESEHNKKSFNIPGTNMYFVSVAFSPSFFLKKKEYTEITQPIINELMIWLFIQLKSRINLETHGVDSIIDEEVLFMKIQLGFLAYPSMAGEIKNTPNPGSSNIPCRIFSLRCPQGQDKFQISSYKISLDIQDYQKQENGNIQLITQRRFGRIHNMTFRKNWRAKKNYMESVVI